MLMIGRPIIRHFSLTIYLEKLSKNGDGIVPGSGLHFPFPSCSGFLSPTHPNSRLCKDGARQGEEKEGGELQSPVTSPFIVFYIFLNM